ncbi:MAG TPA: peptidyl-prolyl cis-trans isomerase [Bacteroidaceae bacterium]|nr:peptidyl-prolyl cis-trans isomerase [Bacteroidaceae bacterium]
MSISVSHKKKSLYSDLRIGVMISAVILSVSLVSCRRIKTSVVYERGKTPLVELNGSVLYEEELVNALPPGYSGQDSIDFAEKYIRNWVEDVMFYQNAIRNIPDTKDIDRLVENYRRSIIEHEYQRRLLDQKFSTQITDEEIEQFYNENSRLFEQNESLVKGLFLKIPAKAPELAKIRRLYVQIDDASFEEIEKYSIRNSARCEFFYENWRPLAEIEMLLPQSDIPLESMLEEKKSLEFKDEENIYLLNISELISKGGIEPLEYAHGKVRVLLTNNNEVEYMKKVREELYQSALEKNLIVYHREK